MAEPRADGWKLRRREFLTAGAAAASLPRRVAAATAPWAERPDSKVDRVNFVVWTYGDIYTKISKSAGGISNISLAAFDHNIQISRFVRLLNEVIAALDEEMSREIEDSAQKIAAERNLTVERVLRPAIADVTIALVGDLSDDRKLLTIRTSPSTPGDGEKPR